MSLIFLSTCIKPATARVYVDLDPPSPTCQYVPLRNSKHEIN